MILHGFRHIYIYIYIKVEIWNTIYSDSHSESAADNTALNVVDTPVEVEEYNPLSMAQEGLNKIARFRARILTQLSTQDYVSEPDTSDNERAEDISQKQTSTMHSPTHGE